MSAYRLLLSTTAIIATSSSFMIYAPTANAADAESKPSLGSSVASLSGVDGTCQAPSAPGAQLNPGWNLDRVDQHPLPLNQKFKYPAPINCAPVYILSDGLKGDHTDFYPGQVVTGHDFVSPTCSDPRFCYNGPLGTGWGAIIGGHKYGVAKDARLINVRVLIDDAHAPRAIDFVQGVEWINAQTPGTTKIGFLPWGNWQGPEADDLAAAVQAGVDAGVLWIVGMGDDEIDPCGNSPVLQIEGILTVSATDVNDTSYSTNYGSCLDIFAPGIDVETADSDSTVDTQVVDGSAAAAAHAAGAAALILSRHPDWTAAQIKSDIMAVATTDKMPYVPPNSPNKILYIWRPFGFGGVACKTDLPSHIFDTGSVVISQKFSDEDAPYDSTAVDDFRMVKACTVHSVSVVGHYFNGEGPAESETVTFYQSKDGVPHRVISSQTVAGVDDGTGSFQIPLSPVPLKKGKTYWMSVRVNMDFGLGGQWGWETTSTATGSAALWQNPGDGFGSGCTSWKNMHACTGVPGSDLMFNVLSRA